MAADYHNDAGLQALFSGTYFPTRARYGRPGLEELLTAAAGQWKVKKEKLLDQAGQIEKYLKSQERTERQAEPELGAVHQAFRQLADCFDSKNGGFGSAPKFPAPHNLIFLMEYGAKEKRPEALAMAEKTLVQMYRGGIFDHIGGGFSRYSTDGQWLVPHFEKMLYDNSLLVMAYIKAYGSTGRKMYGCVAEKILEYVRRELTDSQGGFYCGQDADSDGVEGKYYVFTREEIREVLGEKAGRDFCRQYGITGHGNFEGRSIPNLLENDNYEEICEEPWGNGDHGGNICHGSCDTIGGRENEECRRLYQYRSDRARLHKDDKILVSWNSWMICACAMAGAVLGEEQYVDMAVRADAFIKSHLVKEGRLMVRYRDGDAAGEGKLDDYACYSLALLELYRVTFRVDYLKRAAAWAEIMTEQFFDRERGGFYLYAKDGEQLIVRTKETYDGAMPSGNSVAAQVLYRLTRITGDVTWQKVLEKQLCYLAGAMDGYPSGHSYGLLTMMDVLYPAKELVCTLSSGSDTERRRKLAAQLANLAVTAEGLTVVIKTEENAREMEHLIPYTKDYPVPDTGELFYLCVGHECMQPVPQLEQLIEKL